MVGAWVGEWATLKVADVLLAGVTSKLYPSDLDKAIKEAVKAANDKHKQLFANCERGLAASFLEQLFKGSGLQQLQKPLNTQGKPEVDFLVTAFKAELKSHPEMQGRVDESSVQRWMEVFVETYFTRTDNYLVFQVAKERYFKQLENYFDDVKFAGMAVEGQEVDFKSEKLDQIFVMLDVVEDVRTRGGSLSELDLFLDGRGSRQVELIREQQLRSHFDYCSGKKILAHQLLSHNQSQKVVLLGAPGSGKTTLMSYFAVMLAQKRPDKLNLDSNTDWLPILIRIRDWARHPNLNIFDYARQFAQDTLSVTPPLPPGFFEYWLEDGRALLLLDGLDEVPEEGKRDEIVRYIENFLGQFERIRAIITSRPAGYRRDFFRTDEFPHYEVQPFDDAKIKEFINRWYDSRVSNDQPEAERCKESLNKALDDNARIKLLARNPLVLTIIALIHRYRAILPKQRHELYDKAVETLLKSWDAKRELSHYKVLKYLELDDLRRVMESLAYWIHTAGNTGDKEGGTLIDRDELIEQLSREIKTLKQLKLHEAKEEAKRFVNFIRDRTGLLNEQGRDCYAFVHKTFQEFLCTQEIMYRADNEDDFDIILTHIQEHLHDAHWREVLLLLIAQQKPKKAARAIRTILENGSDYEQWLHRDLLFAGTCLGENPKGLKSVDKGLSQEILEKLVELEVANPERVGERVRKQVFHTICSLNETDFEEETLELLKDRAKINKINESRLLKYQAALGEKEEVTKYWLQTLQDKQEKSDVRYRAASALGNWGTTSEKVITTLLETLQDAKEEPTVRSWTASALGKLGNGNQEVVTTFLEILQDKQHNSEVRAWTASALGNMDNLSEKIVTILVETLQDQREAFEVRSKAAYALGNLDNASDSVVTTLLEILQNQQDVPDVRSWAASALGYLGDPLESVITALLDRVQDTQEESVVRCWAAHALGNLGNTSEPVVSVLLEMLQDANEKSAVRSSAAIALGKLGNASDSVVTALLEKLQDTQEDSSVHYKAAVALGNLGKNSSNVVTVVTQWISQHQDSELVGYGIDALWDMVVGEQS